MGIKKVFRLGEVENSFTIFQTDVGTSPTADSASDTITFTSSDASVTITGDSSTDTINFQVASAPVAATSMARTFMLMGG